jgi:putative toxin-antitoxin system antitoxin component (TIGR02293 family)
MKKDEDRLAAITKAAIAFFGYNNEEVAHRWLTKPIRGLGYKRPVDMVHTDKDTELVLNLINCLEHGIFV